MIFDGYDILIKFTHKLRYIFYPPGWSHEPGYQTAKMIRDSYLKKV